MRTRISRIVAHAPGTVFAAAADPGSPTWGSSPLAQLAPGRFRRIDRVGAHAVTVEVVVTAQEPPHRLAWRTEHEAFQHTSELRFLPHRRGTRIVQVDQETWHHAPWWSHLAARRAVRRELQRRLALLEQALDAPQS